jgi:hypothetical protein
MRSIASIPQFRIPNSALQGGTMLSRRDLLSGAVVGSRMAGHPVDREGRGLQISGAPAFASEGGQISERNGQEIVQALKDLRTAVAAPYSFQEIQGVRNKQVEFLRGQGKFPDYIDVGVDVWFAVYDWHIRHLQPITLGRDSSGRYTVALLTTMIVLRMDADSRFIGVPYDAK